MDIKFVLGILTFVTLVNGEDVSQEPVLTVSPVTRISFQSTHEKETEVYDPHPQYHYSYSVDDSISGDSKSQSETRDGDTINGEYSVNDADGYKRTVKYTADSIHGFNAVVFRTPIKDGHQANNVVASSITPLTSVSAQTAQSALSDFQSQKETTFSAVPAVTQVTSVATKPVQSINFAAAPIVSHTSSYTSPTVLPIAPLNHGTIAYDQISFESQNPFTSPNSYISNPVLKQNHATFSYSPSADLLTPEYNTNTPQSPYSVPSTYMGYNYFGTPFNYNYPYSHPSRYSTVYTAPSTPARQNIYHPKAPFIYKYPSQYF